MTNIRLVYEPFEKKTVIFNEHEELTAAENRICTFLESNSFYDCLMPVRKRYVIWEGLLPELVNEVNDEELRITFEGRESDFMLVEQAFCRTEPAVIAAGYANKWQLVYSRNFETGNIAERLLDTARRLREMCESRVELSEIDGLIRRIGEEEVSVSCASLQRILAGHIEKWKQGESDYRQEKVLCLEMLEDGIAEAEAWLDQNLGRQ